MWWSIEGSTVAERKCDLFALQFVSMETSS